jgi:hypothetical protein
VWPGDGEVFACVVYWADERRIGVYCGVVVELDGIGAPGGVPELVEDVDVLFRYGVTIVVGGVDGVDGIGEVAGGRVKVSSHDVPSQPAPSQMVNRTQPPGKMIRLLVRRRHRAAEAYTFGDSRHGRYERQRLVDGPLRAGFDRVVERLAVHVVAAEDICDEDAVELGGFELFGEVGPVFEGVEVGGLIVGVPPEAGGLVARALGLLEGITGLIFKTGLVSLVLSWVVCTYTSRQKH